MASSSCLAPHLAALDLQNTEETSGNQENDDASCLACGKELTSTVCVCKAAALATASATSSSETAKEGLCNIPQAQEIGEGVEDDA